MSAEEPQDEQGRSEQELWAALDGQTGAERASTLLELSDLAVGKGEYGQALSLTEAAIDAAVDNEQTLARARGMRGVALYGLDRYEESAASHLDAAALFERYDDLGDTSLAYFNASWSLEVAGILDRALECADTSISVAEQLGDPEPLARGHVQRADVLEKLGDRNDEVLQALSAARQAYRSASDVPSVLRIDDRVADLFLERGDYKAAVSLLSDCLAVAESLDEEQAAYFGYRLGRTLRYKGDFTEAMAALQRPLAFNLERDAVRPLAATYYEMASCEWRLDHNDEALRLISKARAHYDMVGADDGVRECDELRSIMLHGVRRYAEAVEVNRLLLETTTGRMRFMARARLADNYRWMDDYENALEYSTPEPEQDGDEKRWPGWFWRECIRALSLLGLDRVDEARAIAQEGLAGDMTNASAFVQGTFHELRGDAKQEDDLEGAHADWARAVAFYLAADMAPDARRLSQAFLPSTSDAEVQ